MDNNNCKEWVPIKDEEREWVDWKRLHQMFPLEYSTFKKHKGNSLFTQSNLVGKHVFDITFIKRLLIMNMKLSVIEQRFLDDLAKKLPRNGGLPGSGS